MNEQSQRDIQANGITLRIRNRDRPLGASLSRLARTELLVATPDPGTRGGGILRRSPRHARLWRQFSAEV